MCAFRMPRKSCSCLFLESTAARIGIVGGDTAGTGHQKDTTGVHNCRIYSKKVRYLEFTLYNGPNLVNTSGSAKSFTSWKPRRWLQLGQLI